MIRRAFAPAVGVLLLDSSLLLRPPQPPRRRYTTIPLDTMVQGILQQDRRAISKAITLVESCSPRHAKDIGRVLRMLRDSEPNQAAARRALGGDKSHRDIKMRLCISGSPGAGKSCFIESLGTYLTTELNLSVAVIAVDPSSTITGGSILGDKTRMDKLSTNKKAFVRPSPSRGHLGGVTARTWETMQVLDSAQFDVTLVETVGVGQSETAAREITDLFALLVPPAAGDELQGVKRGIVEVADAIIVTKCDGARSQLASETIGAYRQAVMMSHRHGLDCSKMKPVIGVSTTKEQTIADAWTVLVDAWQERLVAGEIAELRKQQRLDHFRSYFCLELFDRAKEMVGGLRWEQLQQEVLSGGLSPREAGDSALASVFEERLAVSHV